MKKAIIGLLTLIYIVIVLFATVAHAAPTVCQIGTGCTGTSSAPAYGKVLIGGKNGEYEFIVIVVLWLRPVQSVFGRTGSVTAQSGDYTTAQVTESGNPYYTDARARAALSATYPFSYNSGTGAFSFAGLATTSPWTTGQLAYATGLNQIAGVATSSASCGTGISCSGYTVVGSVSTTIAITTPVRFRTVVRHRLPRRH